MNREKGFTLIELLGVIALLALLSLLVSVPVTKHMQEANQKACEGQLNNIVLAAKQWGEDHKLDLPEEIGTQLVLSLAELKREGYIEEEFKNPITKNNFSDELQVIVTKEGKRYWSYDVVASNSVRADQISKIDLFHGLNGDNQPFSGDYHYIGMNPHNVLHFSEACFSIVNIAKNGSLKLVYEGPVSTNGSCEHVRSSSSGKLEVSQPWNASNVNDWKNPNTTIRKTLENLQDKPDLLHIRTSDLEKLEDATFYVGAAGTGPNGSLLNDIQTEQSNSYIGKVGTLNVTDYVKVCASTQGGAQNISVAFSGGYCPGSYLQKDYSYWFMNAHPNSEVWLFSSAAQSKIDLKYPNTALYIRPVVYLKANTYLTGTGTDEHPFRVANENICQKK